jgi:Na+-driven multidrug efflux pump
MMAGIGMATIIIHCIGGSLLHGINIGYSSLASRAFGAKNI